MLIQHFCYTSCILGIFLLHGVLDFITLSRKESHKGMRFPSAGKKRWISFTEVSYWERILYHPGQKKKKKKKRLRNVTWKMKQDQVNLGSGKFEKIRVSFWGLQEFSGAGTQFIYSISYFFLLFLQCSPNPCMCIIQSLSLCHHSCIVSFLIKELLSM